MLGRARTARRHAVAWAACATIALGAARAAFADGSRDARADAIAATIRVLEGLGHRTSHEKQWQAARWIAARLASHGLSVRIEEYAHGGRTWPNVTAAITGTERPHDVVLVIAHLDSVAVETRDDAPGADDDASGVAALLEVARDLARAPQPRTIRFAVLSNEEQGHLGSERFARAARAAGVQLRAVLNLDTIGYPAPRSPVDWAGLREIGWSKRTVGALATMLRNYVRSSRAPVAAVQVVGRSANAGLVAAVSASLRAHVAVHGVVRDDCG